MNFSCLSMAPYDPQREGDARQLFLEYRPKDHQLRSTGIPKERMVAYLEKGLSKPGVQSICLRDNGRLLGLVTLQPLSWMSEHFGLRMYSVPHLLARCEGPLVQVRLLRYVMEELPEVDFLDCRVAADDIHSAHALEICNFRYVGTEIYMGRSLEGGLLPPQPESLEIRPATASDWEPVLQIVEETHVYNRFMYDPIIPERAARRLYRHLVASCFEQSEFEVLVADHRGKVQGFIIAKMNPLFSREAGFLCGSLDFIGVHSALRKRGLGAALNASALHHLARKKAAFAAVRTLANNYAALGTCYRTGFRITSTSLHFHKWIRRPARSEKTALAHFREPGGICRSADPLVPS